MVVEYTFLFSFVGNILLQLGPLALREVNLAWGLKKDLRKLELTLSSIKTGLLDAEEKQAQNHHVRQWLAMLQDLCLDADDFLDKIVCEDLQRQVVKDGRTSRKLRRFFSRHNPMIFRIQLSHEIKDITERLQEIDAAKARFNFTERDETEVDENKHVVRRETHSFVRATDVIGRDLDKEHIVRQLLSDEQNLSVIPIFGFGGIGKTALTKLVYNDERVNEHFDLKMWVYVSVDFDVTKLIKEILRCADHDSTLELLKTDLQEALAYNRFLLILDDVWNVDRAKWIEFRDLFTGGASGSTIIVTTRSQGVAGIMGNVPTYNLKGLSYQYCWTLFVRWAFKEGKRRLPNLILMGHEIVKKCEGVPLAVRTLGCLLYSKTDERDWKNVRDNEIWCLPQYENDILPALKLSYDQLPHHLKRCFAYCSMFPKGYEFNSDYLIQFWMAHDLIQPSKGNQDLEHIGEQYIKELWLRSFFQDMNSGYNFTFKMHHLMHDLAMSVAESMCSTVNSRTQEQKVSERVRHLSFPDPDLSLEQVQEFLNKSNRLRTIIFHNTIEKEISSTFLSNIIPRFSYLRVLNLSRSSFEVLPSSIGSMRHLRYLDLSWHATIKELPRSIYKLQSLQTLKLDGCLKLKTLPKKIGKLISLRFFEITTKEWCMPQNGVGCLISLRFLKFEACEYLETLFEDIQHLAALRTLVVSKCCNLRSLPLGMSCLSSLKTLVISNCGSINVDQDLGELRLQSLVIEELPQLEALPQWLQGSADTLQYMRIENCLNLESLPKWLQHFESLQELVLIRCHSLSSLPEGMHRLIALEKLKIVNCPQLSRRCKREISEEWHKIAHVPEIYVD